MRWATLIGALLLPLSAAAEPTFSRSGYSLSDATELSLEVEVPELEVEQEYKPHKWLSHTIKNLDLELQERDLDVAFSFDVKSRSARLKLGNLDTDIKFHKGRATLFTKLDLGLGEAVELPEITLVPKTHKGQRYIEYQMPLVRGNIDDVIKGIADPVALLDRLRFF